CFPIMREMEVKHGGLVRAMIARKREKSRAAKAKGEKAGSGGPAGPGGHLTSFRGGLDRLISRLTERHQPIIHTNRAAARIERAAAPQPALGASPEPSWLITDTLGHSVRARQVVIACPTFVAAGLFRESNRDLALAFDAIPYADIAVVATGHRREDIGHPLDGFGFLVPRNQGLRILGSIWTSSIFSGRAPAGHVQFRTMLGGAGDSEAVGMSNEELWATIRREIGPLLGIKTDPAFMRVYRWRRGIPQFNIGHLDRRKRIEQLLSAQPGLHVVGNAYYGVGLNDCVKMARKVAARIGASG
ncbi:MAG: protoporphyrinogen oxidase, partial [Candidatus Zixiibacteriota bacterium]